MSENVQKFRVFKATEISHVSWRDNDRLYGWLWTKNDGFSGWKHLKSGHIISENYTVLLKCETEGGQGIETCIFVLWNLSGSVNGQGSNV